MTTSRPTGRTAAPIIGTHYRVLDEVPRDAQPVPVFPTSLKTIARGPSGGTRSPRVSRDGNHKWCLACNTPLAPNGRSPLCRPCRDEQKNLRQNAARTRARGQVCITKRQVAEIYDVVGDLEEAIGHLSTVYNNNGNVREELNTAMLASKTLMAVVKRHVPNIE